MDYGYTHEGAVNSIKGSTQPTSYTYDERYRVVAMADGNGNTTLYDYDNIGNLADIKYPLASGLFDTTTYTYDADQNLLTEKDGRGLVTTYTRNADPESLVTKVAYSAVSGVTPIQPVNYTYDDYGRRSGMNDGDGSTTGSYKYTYGYDDLDELLSQTVSFTGGPQNQTLAYAHNNDSSRLALTIPGNVNNLPLANSGKFSYAYDGIGRLAQLIQPWSQGNHSGTSIDGQWNYQYQPNGWLTDTWNGQIGSTTAYLHTQYAYTPRGFLASLSNFLYDPQASQLRPSSTYTGIPSSQPMAYDAVGNRLGETAAIPPYVNGTLGGSSADASHQITYTYDTGHSPASLNRDVLTGEASVLFGGGSSIYHDVYTNNYGYDAAYNPTAYSVGGTAVSLPVNFDNQFNILGQFAFDGSGNPTTYSDPTGLYSSSAPPTFTYDPEDRLTSTSSPSLTAAYDGDGMRIKKTTIYGTTYYLYDGGSVPVVEEGYDSGTTPPAYLSGINTVGADGWRSHDFASDRYTTPSSYLYTYDPQGSLVQRSIANNSFYRAIDTDVYDAYGNALSSLNGSNNRSSHRDSTGFGGQQGYFTDWDAGTVGSNGYYQAPLCLTHRYYDPGTGKFLNRDPIGYGGGANLYGFADGNPVNESDPSGHASEDDEESDDIFGQRELQEVVESQREENERKEREERAKERIAKRAFTDYLRLLRSRSLNHGPIAVTPRGVAVLDDDLYVQGTSPLAGNFRGLRGASVWEIFTRIPRGWKVIPQDRGQGIKFLDEMGYERIRIHGPSPNAPAGSNSRAGWTMRIQDRAGNYYNENGQSVSRTDNGGHIPIAGNPNR